jgi:hypothetical protein
MGVLGFLICGAIHVCEMHCCKETAETNDGVKTVIPDSC